MPLSTVEFTPQPVDFALKKLPDADRDRCGPAVDRLQVLHRIPRFRQLVQPAGAGPSEGDGRATAVSK